MYTKWIQLLQVANSTKSPVVFCHGFPDSRLMYADYYAETDQPWLANRSIYALEFPNRQTNFEVFPTLKEMRKKVLEKEWETLVNQIADLSPTNKIVPIAHDLGATYMWKYIREQDGEGKIDKMVSLSVGSSFRYDVWEHGSKTALWPIYRLLFSLPFYKKAFRRPIARIVQSAGYESDTAENIYLDAYHYWDGPLYFVAYLTFFWTIPRPRADYTDFTFPVLFIRSAQDSIASNRAFEETLLARNNSLVLVLDDVNHWFPEQESERVLKEIRTFLID